MEIHMQELVICGRFILNDGQSQAPSFDLDNDVWSYTQYMYTDVVHGIRASSCWPNQ